MLECMVPSGGISWERLGGVALLQEVCHGGMGPGNTIHLKEKLNEGLMT